MSAPLPPRKSSDWAETKFTVTVTRLPAGSYEINISDQAGGEFATTRCGELWTALEMAVPYMVAAAEPDPFMALAKRQPTSPPTREDLFNDG